MHGGLLLFPLVATLIVPGLAMRLWLDDIEASRLPEVLGTVAALSLAIWPLFYLWLTTFNIPLSTSLLVIMILISLLAGGAALWRGFNRRQPAITESQTGERNPLALACFLFVFALILLLRFLNITDIALPLWVDSVHHAAIARLIDAQGTLPTSYRPFANTDAVYYHLGYHTVLITFARLSGLSIERAMLILGQVLNALACVSLYVLAAHWTKRPVCGLLAMIVAGTISLMPAYYVTWGRYTQLAGLVMLPIAMLSAQSAITKGEKRQIFLASVLAAGLFLVHYRVVVFFATFILAYVLVQSAVALRTRRSPMQLWTRALAMLLIALGLSSPWLWRILATAVFPWQTFTARFGTTPEANAVPFDLLTIGNMPILLFLAGIGALLALWRGRSVRQAVVVVLLWVALTAIVHNPSLLGLPLLWILENFSAVIALYVPIALLMACGLAVFLQWMDEYLPSRARLLHNLLYLLLVLLALWTARDRLQIVNPVTVLADADDLIALDWIREHTPPDALFLVNERLWLRPIYVGTDAGYWIPHLTGRRTTMPIIFYLQGPVEYWTKVNELAQRIESSPDPDDPAFLESLHARGVTHIYIGARGGPLSLDKFTQSAHYRQIFEYGAAHVFLVQY